jgi:hypothetical protein
VVIENQVDVNELKRYDKYEARKLVDRIVLDIQMQYDGRATAIAYTPARCVQNWDEDHLRSINMHLSAMLAAQQLGIPIVNAYTGSYPGNYMKFWDQQDQRTLNDWCASNGITSRGIQMMNNIHQPIIRTDTIHLHAPNGKYVCLDPTRQDEAFADRATPQLWETFVRLRLSDHQYAFLAHTDRFITAELHHDGRLVATTDRLGDMGVFTLEDQPDGRVALRADNGKYVALDSASLKLVARADSVDQNCLFTFEPVH